jgi:hypothetical protein
MVVGGEIETAKVVAVEGVTEIGFDGSDVITPFVAAIVYPIPTVFKVSPENCATPPIAGWLSIPPREPVPGLCARPIEIKVLRDVARFPYVSSAVTLKPNGVPAVTLDGGWVVITNREARSGVTVMAVVVAGVKGGVKPALETCSV